MITEGIGLFTARYDANVAAELTRINCAYIPDAKTLLQAAERSFDEAECLRAVRGKDGYVYYASLQVYHRGHDVRMTILFPGMHGPGNKDAGKFERDIEIFADDLLPEADAKSLVGYLARNIRRVIKSGPHKTLQHTDL